MNYKGFDKSLTCRGFQYEVGKTYKHDGKIALCELGFHSCEKPLDVLRCYPPGSRYALVEIGGEIARSNDKTASSVITIAQEITLLELIAASTAGYNSIACSIGIGARAKSKKGNFIVLSEYDGDGNVVAVKSRKIDGKRLKPDTWYRLKNGKFERVEK